MAMVGVMTGCFGLDCNCAPSTPSNKSIGKIEQDKKNGVEYRETWVYDLKLSSPAQTFHFRCDAGFPRQKCWKVCDSFIEVEAKTLRKQLITSSTITTLEPSCDDLRTNFLCTRSTSIAMTPDSCPYSAPSKGRPARAPCR